MTPRKVREFQARLDELARVFPVKPPPTREEVIKSLAIRLTPSEDLMVIALMLRERRQPADEREFQAQAAYVSAVKKAVELTDGVSKRKKLRLVDTGSDPSPAPNS
jgi:hypothetical protein